MLNTPAALDPEKVDQSFVDELCRLNLDEWFFRGADQQTLDTLHPYLVRYLVSYFDNAFDGNTIWDDYFRDFISKRQYDRSPFHFRSKSIAEEDACKCFGISPEEFKKMDRQALIKCYRRLAKETHPDTGGDKDTFREMKEAYECLLARKS
jgi:curved DNA-binding protein CbpA